MLRFKSEVGRWVPGKRRHGMIDDRSALNTGLYDDGDSAPTVQGVTGPNLRAKVMPVWRREMRGDGYRAPGYGRNRRRCPPRLDVRGEPGGRAHAGRLSDQEIAERIASA